MRGGREGLWHDWQREHEEAAVAGDIISSYNKILQESIVIDGHIYLSIISIKKKPRRDSQGVFCE